MEHISPRRYVDAICRILTNAAETLDDDSYDAMLDELVTEIRSSQAVELESV